MKFNELPFNARPDLTPYLLHLTKRRVVKGKQQSAYANLVSILREGKLVGSGRGGHIKGGHTATCFMDVPFASLKYVLTPENRDPEKPRYEPYGICILKTTAYSKGCRPVLYLSDKEMKDVNVSQAEKWRVVMFDVRNESWISWLHEREWRAKGDLSLPPNPLAALVRNPKRAQQLQEEIAKGDFKCVPQSIIPLSLVCQGFLPVTLNHPLIPDVQRGR